MPRIENDDEALIIKNNRDNDDIEAQWSNLNHDLLFLVLMELGVGEFLSFSGVCKAWRSFARCNRNMFMASKTPISIGISIIANENKCHILDFDGKMLQTSIPHSFEGKCIGLTCGYLIFFGTKTRDFWLVNPITRHELHFHPARFTVVTFGESTKATLVFSPSISTWVFIIVDLDSSRIRFCKMNERKWSKISNRYFVHDIHTFKGRIYTLHTYRRREYMREIYELRLYPTPKLALLETKNFLRLFYRYSMFISTGEKLYLIDRNSKHPYMIHEFDVDEMKWVSHEKTGGEMAFFFSDLSHGVVAKPHLESQYGRYVETNKDGKLIHFYTKMWYFFDDCLNVNLLRE